LAYAKAHLSPTHEKDRKFSGGCPRDEGSYGMLTCDRFYHVRLVHGN
jgi:hypothetical protein